MTCFSTCPPCAGCEERDRRIAELEEALRGILKIARDRQAFVMLGPRAFAAAERMASKVLNE